MPKTKTKSCNCGPFGGKRGGGSKRAKSSSSNKNGGFKTKTKRVRGGNVGTINDPNIQAPVVVPVDNKNATEQPTTSLFGNWGSWFSK